MAIETPPTLTPTPLPAPQRGDRTTFSSRVDAFVTWLTTAVMEFYNSSLNVAHNALEAFNSATAAATSEAAAAASATTAASAAGAAAFNPATAYAQYGAAFSTLDLATYRRKTAGTSATDPSIDYTNWVRVSGFDLADAHALALLF